MEGILATVQETLQQGDPGILRRCGTFSVRAKQARVGRNPTTGTAAAMPARRVVRCTAGQTLQHVMEHAATPGTEPASPVGGPVWCPVARASSPGMGSPHNEPARITPRERVCKRLLLLARRSTYRNDRDSGTGKRFAATSRAVL